MVGLASALEQNQVLSQRPAVGQGAANAAQTQPAAAASQAAEANAASQSQASTAQVAPAQAASQQAPGLSTGFLSPVVRFDTQTSQVLFQFRDFETGDIERQIPPRTANEAFIAAGAEQGQPRAQAQTAETQTDQAETAQAQTPQAAPQDAETDSADAAAEQTGTGITGGTPAAAEGTVAFGGPAASTPGTASTTAAPANAAFSPGDDGQGEQAVATAGANNPQSQGGPQESSLVTGAGPNVQRVDTVV